MLQSVLDIGWSDPLESVSLELSAIDCLTRRRARIEA